jgi:hypothetical protein
LMRGDDWIRCCLCFERFEIPRDKDKLYPADEPGKVWDVCRECAELERCPVCGGVFEHVIGCPKMLDGPP